MKYHIGYRTWRTFGDTLGSLTHDPHGVGEFHTYVPRKLMIALCDIEPLCRRADVIPVHHCKSCGFYAFKTLDQLMFWHPAGEFLLGKVALWGHVAEHKDGYRAQFAYPQAFYYETHNRKEICDLAAIWGIEALPLEKQVAHHQ